MHYLFYLLTYCGLTATFLAALIMWDDPSILNLLYATGSVTLTTWLWIMADVSKIRRKTKQLIAAKRHRSL